MRIRDASYFAVGPKIRQKPPTMGGWSRAVLAQGQAHELRLVLDREFVIGRAGYGEDARPLTAEHKRMVIIAALP
jgi:hypothetical protein